MILPDFLPFSGEHTGQYAILAALLLAFAHLLGPVIRNGLASHSAKVISFGGGLAVAYVFLNLIPEIDEAHEYLGDAAFIIILFSFLTFYAVEVRFLSPTGKQTSDPGVDQQLQRGKRRSFWLHISLGWIYTWMMIFALPGDVSGDLFLTIVSSLAIGLHLIYKGYVLDTDQKELFESTGRYILAVAPIAGWLVHVLIDPSEVTFDIFIAVLAGYLMQSVFRAELPSYDQTRFRWMVAGAVVLLILFLIAD